MASCYWFIGKDHALSQSGFVFDVNFLCNAWKAFDSDPVAYFASPGNDTSLDERSSSHCCTLDYRTVFESAAAFDCTVCTYHYIWTYFATLANFGSLVDFYIGIVWWYFVVSEKSSLCCQVVSWFSGIEPKITVFESKAEKIAFTGHLGECFLFEHAKSHWDFVDNWHIEKIESCVDGISDKFLWFLHKGFHFSIWFSDHYSKSAWVLNFSKDDCSFFAVAFVEGQHFFEREIADDIAVEDKENSWFVLVFDDVFSQFERPSCSHCFGLLRVGKFDVILFLQRFESSLDVSCLVVDSDHYFCHSHFCKGLNKSKSTDIWCSTRGRLMKGKADLG